MLKYRTFIKVVETGSLTKAARELGYSQPGVSHIINTLESEMGFPLLKRSKDAMKPTEDGKRILEYCYRIVKCEDEFIKMAEEINGISAGSIHIGATNSMMVSFIPAVISRFSAEHPGVELFIDEYTTSAICEKLKKGTIDIAFMPEQHIKGCEFVHLFDDRICLIVNESHPLAERDKVSMDELSECDCIMPKLEWWSDLPSVIDGDMMFNKSARHHISSEIVGISMVAENLGVYIMSKLQESLLPEHVVIKEFEEKIVRHMGFSVQSLKTVTPTLNAFIKIASRVADEKAIF